MADERNYSSEEFTSARFAQKNAFDSDDYANTETYDGFSNKSDYNSYKRFCYLSKCKEMLISSLYHLRNPITLVVIIVLIVTYILLGVAGTIGFSFYSGKTEQYLNANLDIIVNAILGFFYGPVTSAIGVVICSIVRTITNKGSISVSYIIVAALAGFIHGWILYNKRAQWFTPRLRNYFVNLLSRVIWLRIAVSALVNIIMTSLLFKLSFGYPIREFIMTYSKAGVRMTSFGEFLRVFFIAVFFESIIVFAALVVVDFVAQHAFPSHASNHTVIIENGQSFSDEQDK